jgi:hypothetical protein
VWILAGVVATAVGLFAGIVVSSWLQSAIALPPTATTAPTPTPTLVVAEVSTAHKAPTAKLKAKAKAETKASTPTAPEPETATWTGGDAFDSTAAEYPFGDAKNWTYLQMWDGKSVTTTIHVAIAPGVVIRVRNFVGTRWQVSAKDLERWEQMRREVKERDDLSFLPPLIIIDSINDPDAEKLPENWTIEPFPKR